ncbi:MAG: ion transporter [Deltaproteobacteria bacterium]|nr:ion transporter [Deltaproteobacteria bacterium]
MRFCKVVYSPFFSAFVLIAILVNAAVLGLETSKPINAEFGKLLKLIDHICLFIFCVELAMKMICEKMRFFLATWNIFDFFIVGISLLPGASYFSVLRALRILRAMRLITKLPKVRIIAESIIHALPSIGWLSVLLFIVFYIFAVLATTLFGTFFPEYFGSIGTSMYTNFQLLTMDSWSSGIARPIMKEFPWAYLLFIPFIMVSSFIVLNVFIGVIVNSVQVVNKKNELDAEERDEISAKSPDADEIIETLPFSDERMLGRKDAPDHLLPFSNELGALREQLNRIEDMLKAKNVS